MNKRLSQGLLGPSLQGGSCPVQERRKLTCCGLPVQCFMPTLHIPEELNNYWGGGTAVTNNFGCILLESRGLLMTSEEDARGPFQTRTADQLEWGHRQWHPHTMPHSAALSAPAGWHSGWKRGILESLKVLLIQGPSFFHFPFTLCHQAFARSHLTRD